MATNRSPGEVCVGVGVVIGTGAVGVGWEAVVVGDDIGAEGVGVGMGGVAVGLGATGVGDGVALGAAGTSARGVGVGAAVAAGRARVGLGVGGESSVHDQDKNATTRQRRPRPIRPEAALGVLASILRDRTKIPLEPQQNPGCRRGRRLGLCVCHKGENDAGSYGLL